MPVKSSAKERQMRERLAQEAARIMLESGTRDFRLTKRKAAEHLMAHDTRQMPSNSEIEQALVTYQRLFRADTQPALLKSLRETAIKAMSFFKDYDPKLAGPVLDGTADTNTSVTLHVFSDSPEDIGLCLMDRQIPFQNHEKQYRLDAERYEIFPGYRFTAGDHKIEVIVFPVSRRIPTPLSTVTGRPMERANQKKVEELLLEADLADLQIK